LNRENCLSDGNVVSAAIDQLGVEGWKQVPETMMRKMDTVKKAAS